MIEGWVTAIGRMPERSAATDSLARPGRGGWTVRIPEVSAVPFDRFCEEEALIRSWRKLEESASLPMQCHAFASALSASLLADARVQVFFVRERDGIAALLPLCRAPGLFARWRMVGAHKICEPDDALYRDRKAARLLAEAIMADGRALEIDRVPVGSELIPALSRALRGRGWVSVRPATPTPTIRLEPRWKDPASCFNSGRRSDFRRAARRAGEFGKVSFEMLSPRPDEFDALFDEAIEVEMRSWKREAGTAIAADRSKENCFRAYFRSACDRGDFRIAFMRIDGRAVAMQMALETLGSYWLFKIGFDEAFDRCSPGTLLMLHTIGWAAERELEAYELLGNLEPWIAQFWTREQHDCVWVRAYPLNPRGLAALAADAFASLRQRLRRA